VGYLTEQAQRIMIARSVDLRSKQRSALCGIME
jgi:hypothetical protein